MCAALSAARLGLKDLRNLTPDPAALKAKDESGLRWSYDPDGCCDIRKVEPLARELAQCEWQIEAIAIGNGTASRETETFIRKLGLPSAIPVVMVSESGASIYSASDVAREEFPDKDVTVLFRVFTH